MYERTISNKINRELINGLFKKDGEYNVIDGKFLLKVCLEACAKVVGLNCAIDGQSTFCLKSND